MRVFVKSKYLIWGAVLTAPLAFAQPKLANIEYQANETVINGSSFGGAPKVMMFDNFEHGDKFAKQFANISNDWSSHVLFKKEADGNNAHSAINPAKAVNGRSGMVQLVSTFNDDYKTALISFSVKVPKGTTFPSANTPLKFPSPSAWKFSWLMSESSGHSDPSLFDVCLPQYSGGGTMSMNGNTGMIAWLDKPAKWWSWDSYNHMTSYVRIHPLLPVINPVEYAFSVVNDVTTYETGGVGAAGSFSKTNNSFNRVNIPGWFRKSEDDNFQGLYDNIYVAVGDNALARVVITDSEIYAQSKFAIPVMAKNWTDNQIILDNDVIPRDKAYFVHLFDKNGKRSAKGLKVCSTCPQPPKV